MENKTANTIVEHGLEAVKPFLSEMNAKGFNRGIGGQKQAYLRGYADACKTHLANLEKELAEANQKIRELKLWIESHI